LLESRWRRLIKPSLVDAERRRLLDAYESLLQYLTTESNHKLDIRLVSALRRPLLFAFI
jgi:hypothetical protein